MPSLCSAFLRINSGVSATPSRSGIFLRLAAAAAADAFNSFCSFASCRSSSVRSSSSSSSPISSMVTSLWSLSMRTSSIMPSIMDIEHGQRVALLKR